MALCQEADVPYEDYKRYLKMGRSGYTVVLQRDIDEVFINSYNPEWIRAWDANLDIQPVLDFFAVITYVTEYAWKPEPGESDINKVLESCSDDKKEQMKAVSNTFLTTREMGESEAAYKVISSLSMTGANNSAQWVSLDRPCSIFFKTLLRVRRALIGLVYSSVGGFAVRVLGAGFDFVPAIVLRFL